jgi:topoisomerase-4 subunit A
MMPVRIASPSEGELAVVTLQGRLLVFPMAEVPVLNKGKGNKLVQIPGVDLASGADGLVGLVSLMPGAGLKLHCGKRHLSLTSADLASYRSDRGRRGNHLPRGFQRVETLEAVQ